MKSAILSILIGIAAGGATWQTLQLLHGHEPSYSAKADIDYASLIDEEMQNIIERIPVNCNAIPIYDLKGDTLSLKDAIPDAGARVLKYSVVGCHPCEKKAFDSIYQYASANERSHIIILVSQTLPHDLRVLSTTHSNRFHFYGVDTFPFDYESESTSPMIFDIDTSGHIRNFRIVTLD